MKTRESDTHHRDQANRWGKIYMIISEMLFVIVLFYILLYKLKFLPQEWISLSESIEALLVVFILSIKTTHFYHRIRHCAKCGKNIRKEGQRKKIGFWRYIHEYCDEL